jgi:hypothetical protein
MVSDNRVWQIEVSDFEIATYFVWDPRAATSPLLLVNWIEVYASVFPTDLELEVI